MHGLGLVDPAHSSEEAVDLDGDSRRRAEARDTLQSNRYRRPARADKVGAGGTVGVVRVAFGTDERTAVTDEVVEALKAGGYDVVLRVEDEPWPDVGRAVGEAVAAGEADRGIVCCWTGTGVSIAANKVPGVRAALCTDAETARGARRWNDANVLALGLRLTSPTVARELLEAFLATPADPEESATIARLA